MGEVFLYLFLLICIWLFVKSVIDPHRIFEYPYFMGGICLIFLAPQAVSIVNQPHLVPPGTLTPVLLICFLCIAMMVLGYKAAPLIKIGNSIDVPLNLNRLWIISLFFLVIGLFASYKMNEIADEDTPTQWTGILTVYYTLFQFSYLAYPLFLYFAFRKPNLFSILLAVIAAFPFILQVIGGRREPTAFFAMVIALTLYFKYGFKPPRFVLVGAILFGLLIIPAIGDYRSKAQEDPWEALTSLDFAENFKNHYEKGKFLELSVASYVVDAYTFHGDYHYGSDYWNQMVFRYVPAQFLGKDFKSSLMIDNGGIVFRNAYRMQTGLTLTGIGDSFVQFSYLGCIYYFFLGGFFRYLWQFANSTTNPLVHIFYMVSLSQALLSVTHSTVNFIPGIFIYLVCLWLASKFAKEGAAEPVLA